MDERYNVATPENITFSYDVAGIGSRFMAALVDGLIYFAAYLALSYGFSRLVERIDDEYTQNVLIAVYTILTFLLYWAYYILFELIWGGQSPGKRLVRLRVVRLDGTPASPGQIVIRNLARLVDMFPGFYAVGLIVMFLNEQSRRLGDFAAGTLVVREAQAISLKQLDARTTPAPALNEAARGEAAMLPVHRLTREQRQLVREFMARRNAMSEAQRAKLAMQIAQSLAARLEQPIPAHPAMAERLLELIAGVTG
jgi:uncharacterized RDD family membrane protein YckC